MKAIVTGIGTSQRSSAFLAALNQERRSSNVSLNEFHNFERGVLSP
jgi:hypothetical protein